MKSKRALLTKEENKRADLLFLEAGENCRLSYIYACCIIQNFIYIFFSKRKINIETIHKWFLNKYFAEQAKTKVIDFDFMKIANTYLIEKYNFNLFDKEQKVLEAINQRYIETGHKRAPFDTLEAFCQYIANEGLKKEKDQIDVYEFVVNKNFKE